MNENKRPEWLYVRINELELIDYIADAYSSIANGDKDHKLNKKQMSLIGKITTLQNKIIKHKISEVEGLEMIRQLVAQIEAISQ